MTDTLEVRKNGGSLAGKEELDPAGAREHFEAYLSYLTPSMRADYRRFNQRKITEALDTDIPGDVLGALLPKMRVVDSAYILNTEYPPIPWVVPDYLPPGLTILSGRPKVGKSWLALQLSLSVLSGGKMFGRDVESGKVLYLALEDSERRLKGRMQLQGWPDYPGKVDFMLYDAFEDQIGSLNSGGGKRLMKYIDASKYKLVVVDTFSRSIKGDQLDGSIMTDAIGPLQHQAMKLDIALVFIDHMRKNTGAEIDPIIDVFGSVAKAGVLDTSWALYKEQGKHGAKLAITGRDVDEAILQLAFDPNGHYWHCEGSAFDIDLTEKRKEILMVLEDNPNLSLTELARAIGEPSLSNVQKRAYDLCNAGLITRDEKKRYNLVSRS